MIVVMLITAVETTGDVYATGQIVEKPIAKSDIAAALRADGLATFLGGVMNSFPYTCFAENVGLVRLTRVKSRWVVATAGGIMILLGLLPKAGALVSSIPPLRPRWRRAGHVRHRGRGRHPDPGSGRLQQPPQRDRRGGQPRRRHDPGRPCRRSTTAVGVPHRSFPDNVQTFLNSGITAGSITAILLNLLLNYFGGAEDTRLGASRQGQHRRAEHDDAASSSSPRSPRPTRACSTIAEAAADRRPSPTRTPCGATMQDELFSLPAATSRTR